MATAFNQWMGTIFNAGSWKKANVKVFVWGVRLHGWTSTNHSKDVTFYTRFVNKGTCTRTDIVQHPAVKFRVGFCGGLEVNHKSRFIHALMPQRTFVDLHGDQREDQQTEHSHQYYFQQHLDGTKHRVHNGTQTCNINDKQCINGCQGLRPLRNTSILHPTTMYHAIWYKSTWCFNSRKGFVSNVAHTRGKPVTGAFELRYVRLLSSTQHEAQHQN